MLNFIGTTIKTISFLLFSGFIAGYSTKEIYKYIRQEALPKISKGLSPISGFTNSLTCKVFDKDMKLVPYKGRSCKMGGIK